MSSRLTPSSIDSSSMPGVSPIRPAGKPMQTLPIGMRYSSVEKKTSLVRQGGDERRSDRPGPLDKLPAVTPDEPEEPPLPRTSVESDPIEHPLRLLA